MAKEMRSPLISRRTASNGVFTTSRTTNCLSSGKTVALWPTVWAKSCLLSHCMLNSQMMNKLELLLPYAVLQGPPDACHQRHHELFEWRTLRSPGYRVD